MGLYVNSSQGLQMVSGRGKAEYGASTIRTGTVTNPTIAAESSAIVDVQFTEPMPDAFYMLDISRQTGDNAGVVCYTIVGKTANGFTIIIARPMSQPLPAGSFNATYIAYKLYTDIEYNDILAATPTDASASNKLITESSALKVKVKEEAITSNPSGYLFLPKGTFAASVGYNSCALLAWGENVISKAYINQALAQPAIGVFNPNTAYMVKYHYIDV